MAHAVKTAPKPYVKPREEHLVTFEQFYKMISETEKADLIDGKVIRDSPSPRHAQIISWFVQVLGIYAEKLDLGQILTAPLTVRLSKYQGPQPDVLFISHERLHILGEKFVTAAPDLCIEVMSRSSRSLDRWRKFKIYAEFGVREYWVVDPLFYQNIEFFENRDGQFVRIPPDVYGRLHSKVLPGFWLKLEWIIRGDPKPVLQALEEIDQRGFMG